MSNPIPVAPSVMVQTAFRAFAAIAAALLVSCGGGGNPGECHASPLVCSGTGRGRGGGGGGGGSIGGNSDVTGVWRGTTSHGRQALALTLSNRQVWVLYSAAGNSNVVGGAGFGTYTANGSTLTSPDAVDLNFEGLGINPATITATVTPRSGISGTVQHNSGTLVAFTGSYDANFASQPRLENVAGTYRGAVSVAAGRDTATVIVSTGGSITGTTVLGCRFSGTATPEANANVYNLSIQFLGAPCSLGTSTVTGVAYFDAASSDMYAAAVNVGRTDGFLFLGDKQ